MRRVEYEFLPAVLEVQESPPSPAGRVIIWAIVLFLVIAIFWTCAGEVDIVATAHGKIIPSGRVKVIQPLEIGTVRRINVVEGQSVAAGDVLVELDTTFTEADSGILKRESDGVSLEIQRLRHLADYQRHKSVTKIPKEIAGEYRDSMIAAGVGSHDEVDLQYNILMRQMAEYAARIGALDKEKQRRGAELAGIQSQVTRLEATLPLISKRVNSLKSLAERKLVPENQLLELEEERVTQQQDLETAKNRVIEVTASIREVEMRKVAFQEEYARELLTDLQESERKLQALTAELVKAEQRNQLQKLIAPVDGVVQQLELTTIGGVVTPAQRLMNIVPEEQSLEVEAFVQNRDIGFVHKGQIAEVKVETFPFTKYGTIAAELLDVSSDAIQDENAGLLYATRVAMKSEVMQVNRKQIHLTPGMAVTVEVKTGKRKLIEFILNPLLRYRAESMRER